MQSRTSFINKGILRNDIKSMGWIGILYLLGLLASMPLQILMIHSREVMTPAATSSSYLLNNPYISLFQLDTSPLASFLLIIIPVLAGMMLFRYLHYDQPTDLMHSLPVKRTTLYSTHLTAGIIFLWGPVLITALITALALHGLGIEGITAPIFFNWLGATLVGNLFLFIVTAVTGMMCGMSWVQGALTYVLLLLPAAFLSFLYKNMLTYINGFAFSFYNNNLDNLSPLLRLFNYSHRTLSGADYALYLLLSAVLLILGCYLYKKRQLEMAGNALAFTFLFPVLKYGAAFCGMLLLGDYFNSVQNNNMYWTAFGYLLGSLLGYWLSEILINKSLNVFNRLAARGYVGFALVMIVLISALNYDVTGFEKRIPPLAQVESVYWDQSFYMLTNEPDRFASRISYVEEIDDTYRREVSMFFTNPQTIKDIWNFHREVIKHGELKDTSNQKNSSQRFCFAYKLKNGDMFYREYDVPVKAFASQLKPIYESDEHKMKVNDVLHIQPGQIDVITIGANEISRTVKITDPEQIKQAVSALQKDINDQTYEDITSRKVPWGQITILLNDGRRLGMDWQKCYTGLDTWLQSKGQVGRVLPDDVQYAIIAKNLGMDERAQKYRTKNPEEYLASLEAAGNHIKITDANQIDQCLKNYSYNDDACYQVVFVLKNGNIFSGGFDEESRPDFLI
jgi:ABC-2 type transport system permease protein